LSPTAKEQATMEGPYTMTTQLQRDQSVWWMKVWLDARKFYAVH
jgi:hypothetical protein